MPKKRVKKSSNNKGEKIKSRVAFQGTIDRRKKTFEPKTPATSKPHFQSPDFNSPENRKAQAKAAFFESSSPAVTGGGGGLLLLKKDNYKIAAARNAIIEQPNRSRVSGKLLHMATSPRVGDHGFLLMSKDGESDKPINFCDEPLGSPIRRMKRAMRFVDQNTCITQRVAIDIGSSTRIIIPCFEGVTTVMDLVETVKQRFPEHNVSGLKLFGKVLPVDGFVAELVDSENVLLAMSETPQIEGVKPAGIWKDQDNSNEQVDGEEDGNNDSHDTNNNSNNNYNSSNENKAIEGKKKGVKNNTEKKELVKVETQDVQTDKDDNNNNNNNNSGSSNNNSSSSTKDNNTNNIQASTDTTTTLLISDNIVNSNSNEKVENDQDINQINTKPEVEEIITDNNFALEKKKIEPNNNINKSQKNQPPPVSPSASLAKLKPFTPDRSILERRLESSNGRPKPNVMIRNKHSSTGKLKPNKSKSQSHKFKTESLTPPQLKSKKNEKMDASPAVNKMTNNDSETDPSMMNSLVRDRLLDRIVSLASRGAITPSQQKYLNSLISTGDGNNEEEKVFVPKPPPEKDMKKHSSVRSLKYNNNTDGSGEDIVGGGGDDDR